MECLVIGCPGVGKSTLLDRCLSYFVITKHFLDNLAHVFNHIETHSRMRVVYVYRQLTVLKKPRIFSPRTSSCQRSSAGILAYSALRADTCHVITPLNNRTSSD